jgi:hypothetical protein
MKTKRASTQRKQLRPVTIIRPGQRARLPRNERIAIENRAGRAAGVAAFQRNANGVPRRANPARAASPVLDEIHIDEEEIKTARNKDWNEKEDKFEKTMQDNSSALSDSLLKFKGLNFKPKPCRGFRAQDDGGAQRCSSLTDSYCHNCEGNL